MSIKFKHAILVAMLIAAALPLGGRGIAQTPTPAAQPPAPATQPPPPKAPDRMVYVPAGNFTIGCVRKIQRRCDKDEMPARQIYLDAYFIDAYEVTNQEYSKCVSAGACTKKDPRNGFDDPQQPVGGVTWFQSISYCSFAGKRLPTEAEWEKAARGTDARSYPWGNQAPSCDLAVFDNKKSDGCGKGATWPVGSMQAGKSPYGAFDMAGNVWEWVNDWYSVDYYNWMPDKNPKGPDIGQYRVFRGGAWESPYYYLRSSYRVKIMPDYQHHHIGFRCAKNP
jgi:formylglycine-generating enzyme required for sulfatase activity